MIRPLLALGLISGLAVPAFSSPLPLGAGAALRFHFAGELGKTGLMVASTPTMLLVTAIAPDSPAALADLPSPGRGRVRLAAIDGEAVEELDLPALLRAFDGAHGRVALTVGRLTEGAAAEALVGPFTLPLARDEVNRQRAEWLAARRRFDEAREVLGEAAPPASVSERALLEAHDAAAGGDFRGALTLTAGIAPTDPLYPDAMRLRARVQEARAAEIVTQADLVAARGDFAQALQMLKSVTSEGSWGALRRLREADWKRAQALVPTVRQETRVARAQALARAAAARREEAARKAAEEEAARRKRNAGRRRIKL